MPALPPACCRAWKDTMAGLDASNRDDAVNMKRWDIFGMLMPDTIHAYTAADGVEYIVTANEGDDKVCSTAPHDSRQAGGRSGGPTPHGQGACCSVPARGCLALLHRAGPGSRLCGLVLAGIHLGQDNLDGDDPRQGHHSWCHS